MISPPKGTVQWDTDKLEWIIRGKRTQQLIGRSWFKGAILLSYQFSGEGGKVSEFSDWVGDAKSLFYAGIAHNQKLFNRKDIVLRMFLETQAWRQQSREEGMFGSPPWDQRNKDGNIVGMWNVEEMKKGGRLQDTTGLMKRTLEEIFKASHETGCLFELVVDATIKHTEDGVETGDTDHAIRQVAEDCRVYQDKYPQAAIILSARNEWDAHNKTKTTLGEVNTWARRFYRWKDSNPPHSTQITFNSPGSTYEPEQWPEGFIIVDHGGYDKFDYDVGPEAGKFKMGAIHPGRKGHDGGEGWNPRDWKTIPPQMWNWLWANSRGMPVGFTESMYAVTKAGTLPWYRGVSGRIPCFNQEQINEYLTFMRNSISSGVRTQRVAYFIVHDDIGAMSDHTWNPNSPFEREIAKYFGGVIIDPDPTDPVDPPPVVDPDPDPSNGFTVNIDTNRVTHISHGPTLVQGGSEDFVLYDHWQSDNHKRILEGIWTFIGLDRGDIAEVGIFVYDNAVPLAIHDMHKETLDNYPAFRYFPANRVIKGTLAIDIVGRCNGKQIGVDHERKGTLSIRPHYGIHLVWSDGTGTPVEGPNSPPKPPTNPPEPGDAEPPTEPDNPSEPPTAVSYMASWDSIKDTRFGRLPHLNAVYRRALMSIDQTLIWDGIRNPLSALAATDYTWPYNRNGREITRNEAQELVSRADDLLKRLRHFVKFDPSSNPPVAIAGTWIKGRTRVDTFEAWYNDLMNLWPLLVAANGISNPDRPI